MERENFQLNTSCKDEQNRLQICSYFPIAVEQNQGHFLLLMISPELRALQVNAVFLPRAHSCRRATPEFKGTLAFPEITSKNSREIAFNAFIDRSSKGQGACILYLKKLHVHHQNKKK